LRTSHPSAAFVPVAWKASRRVASVSTYPTASMKSGFHAQPGEDAGAGRLGAVLVVHAEGDRGTVRERAGALLHRVPGAVRRARRRERAGDVVLIRADLEARAGAAGRDGHGSDAEPVAGGVRELRSGPSVGEDAHDEHQLARPGRAG